MKINLLLRSLSDGTHTVLPLENVLPVDNQDVLKSKILHAYPPLSDDGEFFLAFNGTYLENVALEENGGIPTLADYGVTDNAMIQVVRLQEILQQQEQEAAAGSEEAAAALDSLRQSGIDSLGTSQHHQAHADLQALALQAHQHQQHQGSGSASKSGFNVAGAASLINTNTNSSNNNNKKFQTADERAHAAQDLKSYKNKARRNKWRIRAELLPNDGGVTKVTVHDRQYDKLECYVHALLYDYQDPATWTALGATLQHPLMAMANRKVVAIPVQGPASSPPTDGNEHDVDVENVTFFDDQHHGQQQQQKNTQDFTAAECFTVALRLDPMNGQTWVMLGACLAADLKETVALLDRDMNRADCFARACELDPLYPRAWYNLALCLLDNPQVDGVFVGSNQETVESCLLRVLQCDPRHAGAWVSLGLLLSFAYDNAENDVVSMGEESYDRKACLAQALKCDPKHARAWYNIGVCLPPPHYFADLRNSDGLLMSARERELREELRYVQIGGERISRLACFERSVRYKPQAAHHWAALATELPIDQRSAPYPDCPPLAKWDCFAKALELDHKNASAWCGLGQALLSAREKGMNLPTRYKSFEGETDSQQHRQPHQQQSPSTFSASLLGPDTLTPKHCFESALAYKFSMGRAWMSLVYVMGKDYVAKREAAQQRDETNANNASPSDSPQSSIRAATNINNSNNNSTSNRLLASPLSSYHNNNNNNNVPTAKIRGKEYSLKECATYNVEYNLGDARAWGNLAATLTKFNDHVFIREPDTATASFSSSSSTAFAASSSDSNNNTNTNNNNNNNNDNNNNNPTAAENEQQQQPKLRQSREQKFFKIDILQQAISLDKVRGPSCGKWWMDLALCMSEPGSSEDFDPRPDRILFHQQSMTKYDCIEKALELDAGIARAWFELAQHWSKKIHGERVATERAFHDFTLVDLLVRALSLDAKNAQSWMLLAGAIQQLNNEADEEMRCRRRRRLDNAQVRPQHQSDLGHGADDDDDDGEVTMEVDGAVHSFRSTVQRALECDNHLPRGWLLLAKTFRASEKTILVGKTLYTKTQCIGKALEENDQIEGSGSFGLPPSDEEEAARKDRLHRQRHAGNFKREEEPFTDDELYSLWFDLGTCLLDAQLAEVASRTRSESILNGMLDVRRMLERAAEATAQDKIRRASENDVGVTASGSLVQLLPSVSPEIHRGELFLRIRWASAVSAVSDDTASPASTDNNNTTSNNSKNKNKNKNKTVVSSQTQQQQQQSGRVEIFYAQEAFIKALSIHNTSGAAWYGLARSIANNDQHQVIVNDGKWNKQSCLEKALTFDETIKDAWIDLGQILPDDARTGCAYVSMQRISRQSCYERALMLDLAQSYGSQQQAPLPSNTPASPSSAEAPHLPSASTWTKLETARLWCLFGSSLRAGVWVTLNGEALDQQRCFFKALSFDINCDEAWCGLGFIALDAKEFGGTIKIPAEPSRSIEITAADNEAEDDDGDDATDDEHVDEDDNKSHVPTLSIADVAGNNISHNNNSVPIPAALQRKPPPNKKKTTTANKRKSTKKKNSEPKFIEFTAAECFERAIECKFVREGGDVDDAFGDVSRHDDEVQIIQDEDDEVDFEQHDEGRNFVQETL